MTIPGTNFCHRPSNSTRVSAISKPASAAFTLLVFAPSSFAACRCLSKSAEAVHLKTAGAVNTTLPSIRRVERGSVSQQITRGRSVHVILVCQKRVELWKER